ncbi:hypothetical protein B0A55_12043 [Friedmanniomyces simplex]|uniref:NAD-dependent epimerase/dehydratase domain-containing protein n=1 Tax=Friedmanniomyces simplex TaxID=329884 RepID=A0A4U0WTN4_9PEZI|nr:hypothetical protein B0A55_12043 [Friedmanniomyces simplex]
MFGPDSADVLTAAESRIPDVPGPYPVDMVAYPASKIAALNASEAWMKEHGEEIGFDLVSIAPSFVLGRNEQAQKPDDLLTSTTLLLLNMLLGLHSPSPLPSSVAHIDDVAHVHVASLDAEKIPGNRVYLVSSDGLKGAAWATAKEIVKQDFPQALKKQWFVLTGTQPTVWNTVDASETEKVFGIVHKGFETQVKGTVAQYIELKKMEENSVAHIDDVAHVHVASLDAEKIPGNRVYLVSSDGLKGAAWATAKKIVKKDFPQALKKQWFVLTGTQPTVWNTVDASETEKVFGIVHKGFETQVKGTVAQYIELKKMEEK